MESGVFHSLVTISVGTPEDGARDRQRRQIQVGRRALGSGRRVETGQSQHRMGQCLHSFPTAQGAWVTLQGHITARRQSASREGDVANGKAFVAYPRQFEEGRSKLR
jgi:hypothetical protein